MFSLAFISPHQGQNETLNFIHLPCPLLTTARDTLDFAISWSLSKQTKLNSKQSSITSVITKLSLKCSAWKGFIKFASKKNFKKNFRSEKYFVSENNLKTKIWFKKSWSEKKFCLKKFWFKFFLEPIKFLV